MSVISRISRVFLSYSSPFGSVRLLRPRVRWPTLQKSSLKKCGDKCKLLPFFTNDVVFSNYSFHPFLSARLSDLKTVQLACVCVCDKQVVFLFNSFFTFHYANFFSASYLVCCLSSVIFSLFSHSTLSQSLSPDSGHLDFFIEWKLLHFRSTMQVAYLHLISFCGQLAHCSLSCWQANS